MISQEFQNTARSYLSRFSMIGDGSRDYEGSIYRRYFGVATAIEAIADPTVEKERQLALVIETTSDMGATERKGPAWELASKIQRLLSLRQSQQDEEVLAQMNSHFTRLRASKELHGKWERVIATISPQEQRPMDALLVAGALAYRQNQQNHATLHLLMKAAREDEKEPLQNTLNILSRSNSGIDVRVENNSQPTIIITGRALPLAVQKLAILELALRRIDCDCLLGDLENWVEEHPSLPAFNADKVLPVINQLKQFTPHP